MNKVKSQKSKVKSRGILFFIAVIAILFTVHYSLFTVSHAYTHDTSLIKWRKYSAQAFDEAQKENKPIFMLITAVWCYWCHVYEEKTLETKEVADYINSNYIPVFVDYDRRKDIASKYPAGGLPTTVILTPDGEEIVAVPGFIEKEQLLSNLQKTLAYIKKEFKPKEAEEAKDVYRERRNLTKEDLKKYSDHFERFIIDRYDTLFGGFGLREKYIYGKTVDHLLDIYEASKDKKYLDMALKTLDNMAGRTQKAAKTKRPSFDELKKLREDVKQPDWIGKIAKLQTDDKLVGLFDKVEGGFFRYATQRDWSVPHYEKMLDDQADIIKSYLHAFKITKDPFYKDAAKRSLEYVIKSLYDEKDSRFYGSQDADEVYYHFTLEERKKAALPRTDKTSYTHTNANMIITFLYAGDVLNDENYKKIGIKTLDFFLNNMMADNGVLSFYDPQKKKGFLDGQLEDNAWLALAFMEGYKVTKEKRLMEKADALIAFSLKSLYNEKEGGFIERKSTSREFYREKELVSFRRTYNTNSIMSFLLINAHELTKNKEYLEKAREGFGLFYEDMNREFDSVSFQRAARYLLKNQK
ncbi:MAG: thioredoxin domain-containing protein [Deltaproteobacteria bacterium]|nr:thioredoxin domain-containing protein [Deltaproteobacteria bacterium]